MKYSKVFLIFVMLILVIGAIGCSPKPVEVVTVVEAPQAEKTVKELQNGVPFRFVGTGLEHPTIRIMLLGFIEACEDNDVLCELNVTNGFEESEYIRMQEQANALGSTGMVISTYGPFRATEMEGMKKGIPMIGFHTPMEEDEMPGLLGWVATDVTQYGKDVADAMAKKLDCQGPIAITQSTFNDVENEASRSFTEQMLKVCPGITVYPPEMEGGDLPAAIAKASAILVAHPDLKGAFGTTGGSPVTWGKAVEQAGKEKGEVVIIGMDYTRPNLDMVKAGWVYALVGQPIYEETYRCVELLIANLKGEKVEFDNVYPSPIITIDDVDKYYGYADRVDEKLDR